MIYFWNLISIKMAPKREEESIDIRKKMHPLLHQVAFILTLASSIVAFGAASVCHPIAVHDDATRIVCVCNQTYCGDLKLRWPEERLSAFIYESSIAGKRLFFSNLAQRDFDAKPRHCMIGHIDTIQVNVHLNKEHQTILGFGGAFTDSFGYNLASLSKDLQKKLIESYYGENGLQYSFGRVPIGGTDFSLRPYSYDDHLVPDLDWLRWSLAGEDLKYKIPYIKQALDLAKRERNFDLKLFASSSSAPAWMKDSFTLIRGHLINNIQIYKAYAEYLIKFLEAYKAKDINFWGATVQYKPFSAKLPTYSSIGMQFTDEEMINFIAKYLGPALEAKGYTRENFKLMVGDDSLSFIKHHIPTIMANLEVQKYVAGLAFHWNSKGSHNKLDKLHEALKDKLEFMMMSEASEGSSLLKRNVVPGSWERGEHYAEDIIEDLNRGTNAWVDSNLALDFQGGPNWAKKFADSPILVDAKRNEFYKQPMYYSLAHFSRFFKPGSIRVETTQDKSGLMTVAVYNKETNHVVVNILNKSGSEMAVKLLLYSENINFFKPIKVDGRSLTTVVIKL